MRDDGRRTWARRRAEDAEAAGILVGAGYLYRPQDLLVDVADEAALRDRLAKAGATKDDRRNDGLDRIGLQVYHVDPAVDLPALVAQLRSSGTADEPAPGVSVNTVFAGEPPYQGGPGGPPRVSAPIPSDGVDRKAPGPTLAVLDTGWSADLRDLHPALLALLNAPGTDVDELDLDGVAGLDTEAGHGTFISGLVNRLAPDLGIDCRRVLSPAGWGDDVQLALGLGETGAPVINLSLGGYTPDDRPPPAFERALAALGRDRVVLAAAGNHGSSRPFWPAASKHVVAVAALDTTGDTPAAATFSNHGSWVDVCAPGVHLQSTYVLGRQDDVGAGPQSFEGWACWSGTSFATPVVAAAVARLVADGLPPRAAVAGLLAGLSTLPGLEDYGLWYDPGVDLLCHQH